MLLKKINTLSIQKVIFLLVIISFLAAIKSIFVGLNADEEYAVTLSYKGAKAAKVNTWGMSASYYDQAAATIIDHTTELYGDIKGGDAAFKGGVKGYQVGANYTLAKNVIAAVDYYDFEAKEGTYDNQLLWSRLLFTF